MNILKISIIAILLSFMTSCTDTEYYIRSDKGVVTNIKQVRNGNEVTIKIIGDSMKTPIKTINAYLTFITDKQYNINDTIYFKK